MDGGCDWIAAAGGDGTVEAVARTLLDSAVVLGVIPCGTYNNFALSLGAPSDPKEACEVIARGSIRIIDAGFANGEPFFECAGMGLDAAVFPLGEEIKSGGFLKWIDFFRRAYRYPKQRFEFTLDRPIREALVSGAPRRWRTSRRARGQSFHIHALMVTVSNGPYYGMNFTVAPGARLDDGLLTINIFRRFNKLELWWHFMSISSGRRVYSPQVTTLRVAGCEITGPQKIPVHLDGTPSNHWPLAIEVKKSALKVFGDAPLKSSDSDVSKT